MSVVAKLLLLVTLACPLAAVWPSDRWIQTALLAYAPPQTVILVTLAALFLLARAPDRHAWWVAPGVLALSLSVVAIVTDVRTTAPPTNAPVIARIVHWNVASRTLAAPEADIVCRSEAPDGTALPDGWTECREGNLAVAARWKVERRAFWRSEHAKALHVVVHGDAPLSIVIADVPPHPLLRRRDAIRALAEALTTFDPAPDVVVGDLNTPAGAASLRPLREMFVDAHRAAGSGAGYTWPSVAPVLRIDHAFVCGRYAVARYETGWSRGSDHAWQRITLASR